MAYLYAILLIISSSLAAGAILKRLPVNTRRIIVDADAGLDDGFAIFALLDADKLGLIKVEAIVCSNGNTNVSNTCKNAIRILQILKRTDIPVYKGSMNPIIKTNEKLDDHFGKDGYGDLHYDSEPNMNLIRMEPAAVAIHNIVKLNPKKITFLGLAPLTDPALSLKIYHDLTYNLQDMFLMGGNYLGLGNVRDMAEFNFFVDPEAAYIVLNETKRPITLLPWETCGSDTTGMTVDWRFNVLGKYNSSFMDLQNRAESKMYAGKPLNSTWVSCDTVLALVMLYPDIAVQEKKADLTVELHGALTRGEVVVRRHKENNNSKIVLIEKVDFNKIEKVLIQIAKRSAKNK